MESRLLVSTDTTKARRLAILPLQPSKESSMVLVLERLPATADGSSINCTAKFQQASSFDAMNFRPLLRESVYGCLGLVHVENEPFLCLVSDCSPVGDLELSSIYRVNNVIFFSLTTDKYDNTSADGASFTQQKDLTYQAPGSYDNYPEQLETLRHPCQHLQRMLSSGSFYFSYDFDLTRCAQVRYQNSNEATSFWETADDRFFWNRHIIKELLKFRRQLPEDHRANLDRQGILVMATSGFIRIDEVRNFSDTYKLAIVSRLSCKRAGTRFNTRGVDDDGNVANNVETEILLYSKEYCFSYLLIRGSVPVFWEQQGIQLGGHKIQVSRSAAATTPAVQRHMQDLIDRYGDQCVINLLSQKDNAAEQTLTEAFGQHVRALNLPEKVRMVNFDFHQAVKGSQFENLGILMNDIRDSSDSFGYFLYSTSEKSMLRLQTGAFRVNCIDCLDRTNVVQGLICKMVLNSFAQLLLKTTGDNLFQLGVNDMWADNGDGLSRIYTGTGALKSGFTRTGKRTIAGLMDDVKKSATRFIVNNFQDEKKQEIMDEFLGKLANQHEIRLHNPIREAVMRDLNKRVSEYASASKMKIHVGTYNVNGKAPSGESIMPWLVFDDYQVLPEMFVLGFQEIVELSPQQIMATDSSKRQVWENLIVKTLQSFSNNNAQYVPLRSGQLVGAALAVFVRSDLVGNIRNVECTIKKTGMAGLAGNKGGVAIRMEIHDTNICFICAHLAAGHSNVDDRNQDYQTISDGLTFNKGRKLSDHDNIIWLGDFNYRIDGDNETIRASAVRGDIASLARYDQLANQIRRGAAFSGFTEGVIKFAPTYKFDNGTNNYDSSEKNRVPAWTDRILFTGPSVRQLLYDRAELLSSDHKPVKACFAVEIRVVDRDARERIQVELYKKYASGVSTSVNNLSKSDNILKKSVEPLIDFGTDDVVPVKPSTNWWDDGTKTQQGYMNHSRAATMPQLPPRPAPIANWVDDFNQLTIGGQNSMTRSPTIPQKPQNLQSSQNLMNSRQGSQNFVADSPSQPENTRTFTEKRSIPPPLPSRSFIGSNKPKKEDRSMLLSTDNLEDPFADPI